MNKLIKKLFMPYLMSTHFARNAWIKYKYRGFKKSLQKNKYVQLRIEGINKCNSNCIFCAYQFDKAEKKTLDFELYKSAIDQFVSAGGEMVSFVPIVGEALLDKLLLERIKYAKKYPKIVQIELFTNGIMLTKKVFEDLVDVGMTDLFISTSGFEKSQYEKIFRNPFYDKLIRNLSEIALSDRFSRCSINIIIYTDSLFPTFNRQYKKFKKLGYHFLINNFLDNWNGKIKNCNLPGFMYVAPKLKNHSSPCLQIYRGLTLRSDGSLTQCGCRDVDHDSEMTFGNIKDTPLHKLINNGTWQKLYTGFCNGNVPEICKKCAIPTFWNSNERDY